MSAYYGKILDDVVVSLTAPVNPYPDQLWWDSTNNSLKVWKDSQWTPQGTTGVTLWGDIVGKPETFPPEVPIPQSDVAGLTNSLSLKAPLASPVLTGAPTTPTAAPGTNTLQIASTAFVGAAVSTGVSAGLVGKEDSANKGVANGYASLDASAKVPAVQLPSYVDDVQEFANLAAFPGSGSAGIIYVALDTNKTYRWSGSAYVEISPSPGSSDAVIEGTTNLYYTTARSTLKADVTYVDTGLSTKAALSHTHTQGDITNLTTDLAGKAASIHTHAQADVTNLVTDLAAKAPLASPTFTGQVLVAPGTALLPGIAFAGTPDMGMYGTAAVNFAVGGLLKLSITSSAVSVNSNIRLNSAASAANRCGFTVPHGIAPTTPTNGDFWSTTTGFYGQVNGVTVGPFVAGDLSLLAPKASPVFTGQITMPNGSQTAPGITVAGVTDTGIYGTTTLGLTLGGSAKLLIGNGITTNFGNKFIGIAGTTTRASFNVPPGVAPTTPVEGDLWSTASGFYGFINGVTVGPFGAGGGGGVPSDTNPVINGTAAPGVLTTYSRGDHVHPTDTSRAATTHTHTTADVTGLDTTLTGKLDLTGGTLTGKLITKASLAGSAYFNIPPGTAPTTPVDGDIWLTGTVLTYHRTSTSYPIVASGVSQTISGAKTWSSNATFSAITTVAAGASLVISGTATVTIGPKLTFVTPTTATASINLPHGVTPTTPVNGDIWSTSAGGFYGYVNGVTKNLSIHVGTTAPSSPIVNDLWLDIT